MLPCFMLLSNSKIFYLNFLPKNILKMDKVRGTCIVLGEASESDEEEYRPSPQVGDSSGFFNLW